MENVSDFSVLPSKSSDIGDGNDIGDLVDGKNLVVLVDDHDDSCPGNTTGEPKFCLPLASWYLLLLSNYPVATKAITSALLMQSGDLICQLLIEKSETVNLKRMGVFTLLGLVLVGPTLHFWYLFLSKLIPGSGPVKAGFRLTLDQFLFAPMFIGVFISSLLILDGRLSNVIPKLKQDWLNTVVANWKLWIPFQFLIFLLVPQQLQVLAVNIIALAWNIYLSLVTHRDVAPEQRDVYTN